MSDKQVDTITCIGIVCVPVEKHHANKFYWCFQQQNLKCFGVGRVN